LADTSPKGLEPHLWQIYSGGDLFSVLSETSQLDMHGISRVE
jgi:hypothetical protein